MPFVSSLGEFCNILRMLKKKEKKNLLCCNFTFSSFMFMCIFESCHVTSVSNMQGV